MNSQTMRSLQFDQLREDIAEHTISEIGKKEILGLLPSIKKGQIESWLQEVTEAKRILAFSTSIPIHGLMGIQGVLKILHKGTALRPAHFKLLSELLSCVEKLKRFMKDKEYTAPRITSYVYSLYELKDLQSEIARCIQNGRVDDYASKDLLKIRKQIMIREDRMKSRIEQILKSGKYKHAIQENTVGLRNGRYVIPVKKEYRKNMKGTVMDVSASGSTVYIEPDEIAAIQDGIDLLKNQEEVEEQRILMMLTGLIEKHEHEIRIAVETMTQYDVIFAKAKYSLDIRGNEPIMNDHHTLRLLGARHPLLKKEVVPLNIVIGEDFDALVITGPNTGGKTVAMKTVGLLTLMAQTGLHIPAETGSEIAIFHNILVDIGDGQSIEQSLSTFSSKIKNIISILYHTANARFIG